MGYDRLFDTDENKALIAICTRKLRYQFDKKSTEKLKAWLTLGAETANHALILEHCK